MRVFFTYLFFYFFFFYVGVIHTQTPTRTPTFSPSTRTPTYSPTTRSPTLPPTFIPTISPTISPTVTPSTTAPSRIPTFTPTFKPSVSKYPTSIPSVAPTSYPTFLKIPTSQPTRIPTSQPSKQPTSQPSGQPSSHPSTQPTSAPFAPTRSPTRAPTTSISPSFSPTVRTFQPTISNKPSLLPTRTPTFSPSTKGPTHSPTILPTVRPSTPTSTPSRVPSSQPSSQPSVIPTQHPTSNPTIPTSQPSSQPSKQPSSQPTGFPTNKPTQKATPHPTIIPSIKPTFQSVSNYPTSQPTSQPSSDPSQQPTSVPTMSPTITKRPTSHPSPKPSSIPSKQPTSQPSSYPSSQPTSYPTSPTSQPTSMPSNRPTSQPSRIPTRQPTCRPSSQPSSQPTSNPTNPTSQPTSQPSEKPSSIPTSTPTFSKQPSFAPSYKPSPSPSFRPTSVPSSSPTLSSRPTPLPTSIPTSHPTPEPSGEYYYTTPPTAFFEGAQVSGSVSFIPDLDYACAPVHLIITLMFARNISIGSTFSIKSPGITSGTCLYESDGVSKKSLLLADSTYLTASYTEGSYLDDYLGSVLNFKVVSQLSKNVNYTIEIDRSNSLRRSCSSNSTWSIILSPTGLTSGFSGYLTRNEAYPKKCYMHFAKLNFSDSVQLYPTAINITMRFGFFHSSNPNFRISLPGFSNNPLARSFKIFDQTKYITGSGSDSVISGLTWNTSFSWTGYWHEGSYSNDFKNSYITLIPSGSFGFNRNFWINIPKPINQIYPVCGKPFNSTDFKINVTSEYFTIDPVNVTISNHISSTCRGIYQCSGHGDCDNCGNKCNCYDGYGSAKDKLYSVVDDFELDCSSRSCPIGPAISYIGIENAYNSTNYKKTFHKYLECSNNGYCDRKIGQCICNTGFWGSACEKMKCPGSPTCSGRGKCMSIQRLAQMEEGLPLTIDNHAYIDLNETKKYVWDTEFGHVCLCDSSWKVGLKYGETQQAEYFGPSCEFKRCPSGDDPTTPSINETNCEGKYLTGGRGQYVGKSGNLCHVDCSNKGVCDYSSGICNCFEGFTGLNCGTRRI